MPVEFKLPDLGEGIHEGEIIEVLVHAGDKVEDGQTVLIIETDKATAEVPSPVTGTVKEIKVKPGQTVRVGEVLIVFLKEGESEEKVEKEEEVEAPKKGEKKEDESLAEPSGGPVAAAPSTRRLARELGVDINRVKPGGPGGRVTPEDVRAFAESAKETEAEEKIPAEEKKKPREAEEKKPAAPPEVPAFPQFDQVGPVSGFHFARYGEQLRNTLPLRGLKSPMSRTWTRRILLTSRFFGTSTRSRSRRRGAF